MPGRQPLADTLSLGLAWSWEHQPCRQNFLKTRQITARQRIQAVYKFYNVYASGSYVKSLEVEKTPLAVAKFRPLKTSRMQALDPALHLSGGAVVWRLNPKPAPQSGVMGGLVWCQDAPAQPHRCDRAALGLHWLGLLSDEAVLPLELGLERNLSLHLLHSHSTQLRNDLHMTHDHQSFTLSSPCSCLRNWNQLHHVVRAILLSSVHS